MINYGDEMKRKNLQTAFTLYIILMIWLLFIYNRGIPVTNYWEQVSDRLRPVPFSTIHGLFKALVHYPYPGLWGQILYNIGGNIIMFVPLGFFLCALVDKYRSFWRCLGAVAVIMTTVELIQLFTLLGQFDVDDLILNLIGAAIGWLAAKMSDAR